MINDMDTHFYYHENTKEPFIQARKKTMNLQECRILAMVMALPSQMQGRNTWYLGTADSIYKNLELIRRAIIDQGSIIEAGERIGFNPVYDAGRYYLDRSGIVLVSPRKAAG